MLAIVEGIQRLLWLKNSLNAVGAAVYESDAAEYSIRQPWTRSKVHNHLSSPWSYWKNNTIRIVRMASSNYPMYPTFIVFMSLYKPEQSVWVVLSLWCIFSWHLCPSVLALEINWNNLDCIIHTPLRARLLFVANDQSHIQISGTRPAFYRIAKIETWMDCIFRTMMYCTT